MEVDCLKIKEFRLAFGWSRDELGRRVTPKPVSRHVVEYWESGGVKTFRALTRVAKALGVRPESLLKKDGP